MGKKIQKDKKSKNGIKSKKLTKNKNKPSNSAPLNQSIQGRRAAAQALINPKDDVKIDPKASVDKYFPNRKNYHIYQYNSSTKLPNLTYLSCSLRKIDFKSNKFYIVQILEHDLNKELKLFTRWGRIDTKGSQDIKSIDVNNCYKLFMNKCNSKKKEGYFEIAITQENDNDSEASDNDENDSNKFEKLIEAIKNDSKEEAYEINIDKKTSPKITDSKFGGLPYWPKNKQYPKNSAGKKLTFVAQINFEKEKVKSPLPTNGILQFFILGDDDNYGLDFNDQTSQDGFRVIYHEKIDYSINKKDIEKMNLPTHKDFEFFPIRNEFKIFLKKVENDFITYEDYRFINYFQKAYKNIYKKAITKDEGPDSVLEDDEVDQLIDEFNMISCKMLGYPSFCQEDPRGNIYFNYKKYDTVLLQIDSEDENVAMWGDVGQCTFFINKKDLMNKKFTDVLFNFDCH